MNVATKMWRCRSLTLAILVIASVPGCPAAAPDPGQQTGAPPPHTESTTTMLSDISQFREGRKVVVVGHVAYTKAQYYLNCVGKNGDGFPIWFPLESDFPVEVFGGTTVEVTGVLAREKSITVEADPPGTEIGQSTFPADFSGTVPGRWYVSEFQWRVIQARDNPSDSSALK